MAGAIVRGSLPQLRDARTPALRRRFDGSPVL